MLMALNQNYVEQDFIDIYEELLQIVESSTTAWSPRNSTEADPGVVILKLIAFLEDKHNYKSDMARNQGYPDTVTDRQSAYELLEMLGYIMRQARCATGEITLAPINISSSWTSGLQSGEAISIPKFTKITDATGTLKFFTLEDTVIARDDVVATPSKRYVLKVQAGEPFQITKDGNSTFTLKDVDEDGRLYLGKSNLAQNGVFVYTYIPSDAEGTSGTEDTSEESKWEYLDFAILKPRSRWYSVYTSSDNEMYIQFPSNFEELIGSDQFVVYGTYTEGAGSNIAANMLSRFEETSYRDYFAISQTSAFTNGQDLESIQQATENYYATKDVCNTLVSAADYEAAIKYLTVQLTNANGVSESTRYQTVGERYFSNAVVRTAQDRRTKVRTVAYGVAYDLFQPDKSKPFNQVDVIALQYSNTYTASFVRIAESTFNVSDYNNVQTDLTQQLASQTAIDADVVIDGEYPRILAVTTPEMTIRVANYTDTAANNLRSSIKNYFESTYNATNLVPGKELDYQTIIDDITALSPDILSVSMRELQYTAYLKYEDVDGSTDDDEDVSLTVLSDAKWRQEVLARAALAGDVPLFRFYNRQNTLTKTNVGYSALASVSGSDSGLESVISVPLGTSTYETKYNGLSVAPKMIINPFGVSSWSSSGRYFPDSDVNSSEDFKSYSYFRLGQNHIVQFRRALHREGTSYGYGMKYLLTGVVLGSDLTVTDTTVLIAGTILAQDSVLNTGSVRITSQGGGTPSGLQETASTTGDSTTYSYKVTATTVEISSLSSDGLTLQKGSILTAKTKVAIGSTLNGQTYAPQAVADGQEYELKDDEKLTITDSSNKTIGEYTAGTWIMPSGLSLSFSTASSTNASILSTVQSISILVNDSSTVTTEFVYFLSLNSADKELTISPGSEYMLEENELFVYADKGVTEYVTFGPGTVLRNNSETNSIVLTNTPATTLENIQVSDFKDVPAQIEAQSYELTNYLYGSREQLGVVFYTSSAFSHVYPLDFTQLGEDFYVHIVEKFDTSNTEGKIDGTRLATFKDSAYETRIVVQIQTDADGVAAIAAPVTIDFKPGEGEGTAWDVVPPNPTSTGENEGEAYYLMTSTIFSSVYVSTLGKTEMTESGESVEKTVLLLPPGVKTKVNKALVLKTYATPSYTSVSVTPTEAKTSLIDSFEAGFVSSSDNNTILRISIPQVKQNERILDVLLRVTFAFPSDFAMSKANLAGYELTFSINQGSTLHLFESPDAEAASITASLGSTSVYGATLCLHLTADSLLDISITKAGGKAVGSWARAELLPLIGMSITLSDLSYILDYSTELQSDSSIDDTIPASEQYVLDYYEDSEGTSSETTIVDKIIELDTEHRYDPLSLPTEAYSHPLQSLSFFNSSHPLNRVTFPYIKFDANKIKIIRSR